MKKHKLEIACFNLASALIAEKAGADRIELCENVKVGGITPNYELFDETRAKISIPIFVMIRPRAGNFNYTDSEFEMMKKDIQYFKDRKVNGFVFGILNKAHSIDLERNNELVQLAYPLPCTFHRAFDETSNTLLALENVIKCQFKYILSSGHQASAVEGTTELEQLVYHAKNRISIMPGGGIRSKHINHLKEKLNVDFFHSSAIKDKSEMPNYDEIALLVDNLKKV
jgi:copper homeostasis protein